MEKYAITVDKGIHPYEIRQQVNGAARLVLGGAVRIPAWNASATVYLRIVSEETGEEILPWEKAETVGGGRWEAERAVPTGGLYALETKLWDPAGTGWIENAEKGEIVRHFGVGDVFVIAGQSNASGTGRGVMTDAPELGVHALRNSETWDVATHPIHDTLSDHSPHIAFGKWLKRKLGYPIGLVPTAVGGTRLSRWHKAEGGDLYRGMIELLGRWEIKPKAMLWYQGCSDAIEGFAASYGERFASFVFDLRRDLDAPSLPLLTFQLNDHHDASDDPRRLEWSTVREAQRRAAKEIPFVYVVPTVDMKSMSDGIHNSRMSNVALGERMGKVALYELYGIGLPYRAPELESATLRGGAELTLRFANVTTDLMAFHVGAADLPVRVEDGDGVINLLDYRCHRDTVTVKLARAPRGRAYVSCQYGTFTRYLHDMGSQLPALCCLRHPITEE